MKNKNNTNPFTSRQTETLYYVSLGKDRQRIATAMGISVNTVGTYLTFIHKQSKTKSLSELIIWAQKNAYDKKRADIK